MLRGSTWQLQSLHCGTKVIKRININSIFIVKFRTLNGSKGPKNVFTKINRGANTIFTLLSNVLIGGYEGFPLSLSYVSHCVLEIEDELIFPDIRAFRSTEHKESIMDNLIIDFAISVEVLAITS